MDGEKDNLLFFGLKREEVVSIVTTAIRETGESLTQSLKSHPALMSAATEVTWLRPRVTVTAGNRADQLTLNVLLVLDAQLQHPESEWESRIVLRMNRGSNTPSEGSDTESETPPVLDLPDISSRRGSRPT